MPAKPRSNPSPSPTARRVFGYARVSSVGQAAHGGSLADQQQAISKYAESRGWKVEKENMFVEAQSGGGYRNEKRKEQEALLSQIRAGDVVLVDKLDRWSRNPEFSHRTVREILEKRATIYFVSEAMDPSTREGDTRFNFAVAVAREEHKRIRERMVEPRERIRDDGLLVEGKLPLGLRRKGGGGLSKNELVVIEDEAALVRRMFAMSANGTPYRKIAKTVGVNEQRVLKILRNRIYIGQIRNSDGDWIKARHAAIVDAKTFQRAQEAIDARRAGGTRPRGGELTSTWWLRDVARCTCGARMSSAMSKKLPDGTYRRYYYACVAGCRPSVPVRIVEEDASHAVIGRLFALRHELQHPPAPASLAPAKSDEEKRAALVAKRERYVELFADGTITKAALKTKLDEVDAKLLALEAQASTPNPLADLKTRRELLVTITGLYRAWDAMKPERRRQIVNLLATAYHMTNTYRPTEEIDLSEHAHQIGFVWRSAADLALADVAAAL